MYWRIRPTKKDVRSASLGKLILKFLSYLFKETNGCVTTEDTPLIDRENPVMSYLFGAFFFFSQYWSFPECTNPALKVRILNPQHCTSREFYDKCNSPIDWTLEKNTFVESCYGNNDINLSHGADINSTNLFIREHRVNNGKGVHIFKEYLKSWIFLAMINEYYFKTHTRAVKVMHEFYLNSLNAGREPRVDETCKMTNNQEHPKDLNFKHVAKLMGMK